MRRWLSCLVILLCLPGIFLSARRLPVQTHDMIAEKYAGWSGVLQIRCFEGWTGGDLMASWIGRCASDFEKLHSGVYIEVQYADAAEMENRETGGARGPDMVIFPPGCISSWDGFVSLGELPTRAGLLCEFACPIALGGYGWAIDPSIEEMIVPQDEPWRSFSRGAAGIGPLSQEIEIEPPGIELGLPAMSALTGARCVTQREILRGNVDSVIPGLWTDQVLYLAVSDRDPERAALSLEFLKHLLSDKCQAGLKAIGLFPATNATANYPAGSAMAMMEAGLMRDELQVLPPFG